MYIDAEVIRPAVAQGQLHFSRHYGISQHASGPISKDSLPVDKKWRLAQQVADEATFWEEVDRAEQKDADGNVRIGGM